MIVAADAWLDSWQESTRVLLRRCVHSAARYSDDSPTLPHYARVARRLWLSFQNEELARAAYLHGVHPADHGLLSDIPGVTPTVLVLLDERNRIRSIGSTDEMGPGLNESEGAEISRLLVANVLPGITQVHAAVLFVVEQLDHADPDSTIIEWTRAFARQPSPLPRVPMRVEAGPRTADAEHIAASALRGVSLEGPSRVAFLRYVVGPVAEHVGLWQESMSAENLALAMESAQALAAIANCATGDAEWKRLAQHRVERVREILAPDLPLRIAWEWHNPATIARELGSHWNHTIARRRFERTGYVSIECADESECYRILGRLHAASAYQRDAIRDFIGAPRLSGYRALHSILTRPSDDRRELEELTPVHILTAKAAADHLQPPSSAQLQRIVRQRSTAFETLRAFAPDGRQFDLAPGATVLNFAVKVHQSLLPYLRGATVNRKPVPITHRLADGDVVWLDIDPGEPRPLPEDWEQHVPESTRRRIRRAFRHAYRPTLINTGREWLRERLAQRALLDDNLDAIIEEVEAARHAKPRGSDWLLRAFGIHTLRARGLEKRASLLDDDTIEAFVRAIEERCASVSVRDELDLPPSLRRRVSSAVLCGSCNPDENELEGTLCNGVLTVHRAASACSGTRVPIRRVPRRTQDQFFVVDATNRNGIVADILAVFRRHRLEICDVAARRMSAGWIVVRIGVDFSGIQRRDLILRELDAMPEVVRAVGPGAKSPPFFEHVLPARPLASAPFYSRGSPFHAGSPIEDDRMFYGMVPQLEKLHRQFETVQTSRTGRFVFVTGPLKTGKTSLILAFLRSRDINTGTPVLTHYSYAHRATWNVAATELRREFLESAAAADISVREPGPTLEDAIAAVRRSCDKPIIFVVDEMVGLLRENSEDEEQIAAILRFDEMVRRTPRLMVIWIGPQAPARRVNPRLNKVLQSDLELHAAPLSEPETAALLQAAKLGAAYRIEAHPRLAREVWRITGGNPYWVTELASIMYELARAKPNGSVVFTMDLLEAAKQTMFERERVFSDRVYSPHDGRQEETRTLKSSILHHLVASGEAGLPADDLCERLEIRMPNRMRLNDALDELRLGGTLSVNERRSYTIHAPILAEYLRYSDSIRVRES